MKPGKERHIEHGEYRRRMEQAELRRQAEEIKRAISCQPRRA